MAEDLLMNTINAKRQVGQSYQILSDAVYEFEEKWEKKGVNISADVDWKTKTILYIVFRDRIPDEIHEIIEDFQKTFNVELDEIKEEKSLQTSSRKFTYTHWKYEFLHVDRFKDFKEISS